MSLVVQLPKFEGPLALLLYLIRKEEMDIFDIKIHEITHQYLEYIKIMKELDLELAGEFVAMAATLIQIKSRMLLPQYDEKGEVIENEDPRKELVQKLLEYQKYQEAARLLYERPLVGREMWTRGIRESLDEPPEEIEVEDNGLFSLISMYRLIMRSAKKRVHQVTAKAQSIASRILEIKELLVMGQRKTLNELIVSMDDKARQLLITFLSLLELGKLGFVSLYQSETYGDIWVDLRKPIEGDAVSRVEEYDTVHSEEVANKLFQTQGEGTSVDGKIHDVDHTKDSAEEFVLKDNEDFEEIKVEDPLYSEEEMASDDEILEAERELAGVDNSAAEEVFLDADIQAEETLETLMQVVDIAQESPQEIAVDENVEEKINEGQEDVHG
ncbi:MAG: segregation/condensation protein A [Bdellovibrionaceae bacterium]|nr:segregation/condensation protein A [Pseudobdellovibrionaceae bacterium]